MQFDSLDTDRNTTEKSATNAYLCRSVPGFDELLAPVRYTADTSKSK